MKFFLFLLIPLLILPACEEPDPYARSLAPSIAFQLIATQTRAAYDTLQQRYNDSLNIVRNALAEEMGPSVQDSLRREIVRFAADSAFYAENLTYFRSGRAYLQEFGGLSTAMEPYLSDTIIGTFRAPLNPNSGESGFYLKYFGRSDTIFIYYDRDTVVTADGIRIESAIQDFSHTADSSLLSCRRRGNVCNSRDATIEIYF
jgi:hypothetical protein